MPRSSRFRSLLRSAASSALAALLLATFGLAQGKVDAALDLKQLRKDGQAAVQAGDFQKAAAAFQQVTAADPKDGLAWQLLGYSLHAAGKLDEALPVHLKATEFPATAPIAAYNVACVHALQGRPEDALRWLEKAVGFGFDQADHLENDQDFAALRKDPRFVELLAATRKKAKASAGALQAYVQTVERRNSRIAWFHKAGSPGQLSIDYSPVPWQDKYASAFANGEFVGKKWRLGADFWTRLDTSVDLSIGGVKVPAGYYYLTAEQRDGATFVLALHDAAAVKKLRLDAYMAGKLQGGIEVPMEHRDGDGVAKELSIVLATDEGSKDHGTLEIRFGGHVLSAPLVASLGK